MTKIILCMILKNEGRIIQRVMASALPIIDGFSICDTGSTDDTNEKIREFASQNNLPGDIHDVPWQNFGYNRSQSFLKCRETATRLGFKHEETYALFLDGDHILKIEPGFDKEKMSEGGYQIPQVEYTIRYYNTRFARLSNNWRCVGVTHEYWSMEDPGFFLNKMDNPWIEDKADGGCKSDKFERDIRLLKQGLIDEPGNVRYMFYLGQSYKDNRQYDESIDMYKKRIDAGGWDEEVYYSMLQLGRIYSFLKDIEKTAYWYLRGWNFRPSRNESLVELAFAYKDRGDLMNAFTFAKLAADVPFPVNDVLFVNYRFYPETAHHIMLDIAPKINKPQDAIEAANHIVLNPKSGETAVADALRILTGIYIKVSNTLTRVMKKSDKTLLYSRMKVRGKVGVGLENGKVVSVKDMNSSTDFVTSDLTEFEKLKGKFQLQEIEKLGKVAVARVVHNGQECGAIFKFGANDVLERAEVVSSMKRGCFAPFYCKNRLAILQNISPLSVLLLDDNATIVLSVTGETGHNFGDNSEMTSNIVEYRGRLLFVMRWKYGDTILHRFVALEKSLKGIRVSLPFILSANVTDRITSFVIVDDERIQLYLDNEGEAMTMHLPIDVLNQVFKPGL